MIRRRFSNEYKQEAMSLAQQSETPVAEIVRNPWLNNSMLRRFDDQVHIDLVSFG